MDGNRFDSLARSLAAPKTRRGLLGSAAALAAGLLGGLAGALRAGDAGANPGPKKCKYQGSNCKANADCCTLTCCNRTCCGDGQACCNGQCVRACPQGQTLDDACACAAPPTTQAPTTTTTTTAAPNPCAGQAIGASCGDNPDFSCAESQDTGEMVCVDPNNCCAGADSGCTASSQCNTPGQVCVDAGGFVHTCYFPA